MTCGLSVAVCMRSRPDLVVGPGGGPTESVGLGAVQHWSNRGQIGALQAPDHRECTQIGWTRGGGPTNFTAVVVPPCAPLGAQAVQPNQYRPSAARSESWA